MKTLKAVSCEYCGATFVRSPHDTVGKRYDTRKCRTAARRMERVQLLAGQDRDGSLPPEQKEDGIYSKLWWDGRTRYSEVAPLRFPVLRKCFACGSHSDVEWLTIAQARLLCAVGLGSCRICGGGLFLDQQELAGPGSPQTASPARTHVQPVRTAIRGAA